MLYLSPIVESVPVIDDHDDSNNVHTLVEWRVTGIRLSEHDGQYALAADFDVKAGDRVHCVYAVYSTGDSFGHYEGSDFEVIGFYKSASAASETHLAIETRARPVGGVERYKYTITLESGKTVTRPCLWDDYFGSFDFADIYVGVVQDG